MAAPDRPTAPEQRRGLVGIVLGVAGALAVVAGAVLHLQVWNREYRPIPDDALPGLWVVKTGFPIQAGVSFVVAAAVVAVSFGVVAKLHLPVLVAALLLQVGSVAALLLSRGPGLFGWQESGYTGKAGQILVIELVASALLAAAAVVAILRRRSTTRLV